jgi:putative FmdB family regulatory protein
MPLYQYECESHGRFDELRSYDAADDPIECPSCGLAASRVLTRPRLRVMAGTKVAAMDRNEKSRHEPHVCSSGCSHRAKSKETKPRLQSYTGSRPWVIEHG